MLDVHKIKEDFPIFENYKKKWGRYLSYLDSAASSQTPRQVVLAMDDYYFNYRSNVHRSPYKLGIEATEAYESARATVAKFIGAKKGEIIFTSGATMGANMLVAMLEDYLKIKQGAEILASVAEHHSNLVPFQELALRTNAAFRVIPLSGTDIDYEKAEKLIGPKTKIVTISLASNVLGTIYEVKRVIKFAKKVGAITIVDASKAAGHISINVRDLGCDFLFFSGHKMLGPTGIGVLYGREELLTRLYPGFFGGGIVSSVTVEKTSYLDIPMRFEPGTPNVAGAIGLARAMEYIESLDIGAVTKHSQELVRYAIEKLSRIPGLKIVSEKDEKRNIGIVSFTIDGIHSHDVAEILDRGGVSIRGGHHCAMPLMKYLGVSDVCRTSFYVYNDKEDIDRLAEGIEKAKSVFGL